MVVGWVSKEPHDLYLSLKDKKYKGIINIYTSIIFDIKHLEIKICTDAGRLTRPLLRVNKNELLITDTVINNINNKKLSWDDLLISCKIDNSILEYIDPDEQNHAMIAMELDKLNSNEKKMYQYTHCEIHPSTIFGILASCIPFPEHNQSPRNTYPVSYTHLTLPTTPYV